MTTDIIIGRHSHRKRLHVMSKCGWTALSVIVWNFYSSSTHVCAHDIYSKALFLFLPVKPCHLSRANPKHPNLINWSWCLWIDFSALRSVAMFRWGKKSAISNTFYFGCGTQHDDAAFFCLVFFLNVLCEKNTVDTDFSRWSAMKVLKGIIKRKLTCTSTQSSKACRISNARKDKKGKRSAQPVCSRDRLFYSFVLRFGRQVSPSSDMTNMNYEGTTNQIVSHSASLFLP